MHTVPGFFHPRDNWVVEANGMSLTVVFSEKGSIVVGKLSLIKQATEPVDRREKIPPRAVPEIISGDYFRRFTYIDKSFGELYSTI